MLVMVDVCSLIKAVYYSCCDTVSLHFVDELSTFGRWLDGGTPIRNKEFTYVPSEIALDLVFIHSLVLAVPAVWYESIVLFHPSNAELVNDNGAAYPALRHLVGCAL